MAIRLVHLYTGDDGGHRWRLVDELPDLVALAADGQAITIARFDKPVVRLDTLTLAPSDPVDVVSEGTDVTSAPPGTWVSTKDGLVAVDDSGAPGLLGRRACTRR